MQDQIYIETPRLLLRSWKLSDEDGFIKMNQDIEVMKYFPSLLTEDDSREQIKKIKKHFQDYQYGVYALELKAEKKFIGFTGFAHPSFQAYFTPCIEIGWRIDSPYWNKGLGTEAATACLTYGFQNLGFDKVYSFTSIFNIPSEKLMQKIGMQKLGAFDHPKIDSAHPFCQHVLYLMNKD